MNRAIFIGIVLWTAITALIITNGFAANSLAHGEVYKQKTDNGSSQTIASAYVVPSVTTTHDVVVTSSDIQSFPFFDDFSTDKGWSGYEPGGWERRPAQAGTPEPGNPDPGEDHSASEDNYVLGYAIGGNYPENLPEEKEIISPEIDCTGMDRVFLKFWRYLNVESSESDYARIYISNDRTNWVLIYENPETGTMDNQWTPVVYDISRVAAGEKSVFIKFTMGPTDSTGNYSGWNIDDLEVTPNPVYPAEGTIGSEFTIQGSGFGTKKGKVLIGNTSLANTSVTVLFWSDRLIRCRLTKVLTPGVYKVFPPGIYDVTIVPQGSPSTIHSEAFVVRPPEIYSIDQGAGTAWEQIAVRGKFFGTVKGKIYLEHDGAEGPERKNCKVSRWTMDSTTGEGEIVFVVPRMLPKVYDVVVDLYGVLPETEEAGGFTVTPPEILSIQPSDGTAGDGITVRGNFFGLKTKNGIVYGKVHLMYSVNGNLIKKKCPVVSWTTDFATDEGEIVFVVPPGLAPGVYDLLVTNGVGTDAVLSGFTVKAPEIVDVLPKAGKAGDKIILVGNYFGSKKGTEGNVSLRYSANGTVIKKNCSVVTWTADPATGEGTIEFLVPKDLPPWTYDLTITNSVGSDVEPSIFTVVE